jgi:glycogen debranching enzyme/glycosidase
MSDLHMSPAPGTRFVHHAGDLLNFSLRGAPAHWQARLRTNIGRADRIRDEIVHSHFQKLPLAGASWRDIPMSQEGGEWKLVLPLTEVGWFRAKAYAVDERGSQHWPGGPDLGISVHPSWTRTANTIYCAFPRMFGAWSKKRVTTRKDHETPELKKLDEARFTVIPPSGTLRDVIRELPHILETLGCRILHLLPISPAPTTFARFGRFGSPYAVQDLTGIDPALIEFDRRTTGVDQFQELTYAVHSRGARLFLDLVINHTGWGSQEWETHPEWFLRKPNGEFESPGAWSVVWEDLVELDQRHVPLWDYLAGVFLTWCRRGVDGFRCDAGYKIPVPVWQYITARVRQEFPDTVFLLEGLGGPWETTEALLGEGGMQWAYSELFQNFGGLSVGGYLEHHLRACRSAGTLVHYSETHDNARLAAHREGTSDSMPERWPSGQNREDPQPDPVSQQPNLAWSRHRNRLCALTSISGGFGFTCGVEWAATEQINVHSSRGLAWGREPNLVSELAALNRLLADHPCFFDGAKVKRLSPDGSPVVALHRVSAEGKDSVLVLLNTDPANPRTLKLDPRVWAEFCCPSHDLLRPAATPEKVITEKAAESWIEVGLDPGAAHCLSLARRPNGLSGDEYRRLRALADWARAARARVMPDAPPEVEDWRQLARQVEADPAGFLARTLVNDGSSFQPVIEWALRDRRRVTPVPPNHWLLIRDSSRFRARLTANDGSAPQQVESIPARDGFIASFPPRASGAVATLDLERYAETDPRVSASIRFLDPAPAVRLDTATPTFNGPLVLLTNNRGGMTRLGVDLGRITSKYDCLLGANLNPDVPVDRHVLAKRIRVWVNADGFITPLNGDNLVDFEIGPPAHWRFVANAGDGRSVEIHLVADMLPDLNTVVLQFSRPDTLPRVGRVLPPECDVRLTVRVDLEDRNFHWETRRSSEGENFFNARCRPISGVAAEGGNSTAAAGFEFSPASDRHLRVFVNAGVYHHQPEWSEHVPHPVEATRGMTGEGDAWSPGWFEVPLSLSGTVSLTATADPADPAPAAIDHPAHYSAVARQRALDVAGLSYSDAFGRRLVLAAQAFIVRRDGLKTVIAGYPWFLDWGRDSLICARGLLAAGLTEDVRQLLLTFGRFEENGTLPNSIHGENAANRDTSDAPLWFGIVCEEYSAALKKRVQSESAQPRESAGRKGAGEQAPLPPAPQPAFSPAENAFYDTVVDAAGRPLREVLRSIACGYLHGTSNGIRVDAQSGLVWSPPHFTWMDTNYPAATPRAGYPVEIQALWIRLLRQLAELQAKPWEGRGESWADLAHRTAKSFDNYFWLEDCGWFADCLPAAAGNPARSSPQDNALRSNCLLPIAFGLVSGERARRTVAAAARHLVVPGALRSLAPLSVIPPLPVWHNGRLLNEPNEPYWGHYEGDEDTRRKPAYHNGTAWTWTFPTFCEALVLAHDGAPAAVAAARAYLGSMATLMSEGCLGHLPEILDGDAPHTHRGCDAQAWGVTEALRVWRWVNR